MTLIDHAEPVAQAVAPAESYGCPEFSWSPSGPVEESEGERRVRSARKWARRLLLVALTIGALILLIMWVPGAFASAPGGCGGG